MILEGNRIEFGTTCDTAEISANRRQSKSKLVSLSPHNIYILTKEHRLGVSFLDYIYLLP